MKRRAGRDPAYDKILVVHVITGTNLNTGVVKSLMGYRTSQKRAVCCVESK